MIMINPVTVSKPDETNRQIDRLTLMVADLQSENRTLRKRLPTSTGDMKRLRQAHRDARAMLMHRFNGYSISRQNCLNVGIPRRRWPWAIALLKLSRIHDGTDVTATEFNDAIAALNQTFASLENAGTIERLKWRLAPSYTK